MQTWLESNPVVDTVQSVRIRNSVHSTELSTHGLMRADEEGHDDVEIFVSKLVYSSVEGSRGPRVVQGEDLCGKINL